MFIFAACFAEDTSQSLREGAVDLVLAVSGQ